MIPDPDRPTVNATETSLAIIDTLQNRDGATLTELADVMEPSKSTLYNHLCTLENHGYVVQEGNTYYVGFRYLNLGKYVQSRKPAYRLIKQTLADIGKETGAETDFSVVTNGRLITLAQNYHETSATRRTGTNYYMHNTAAGKAILAHWSSETVDEVLDHWGLPETTENTITSRERLYNELEEVNERGFAINDEESILGLRSVGAIVTDRANGLIGAISISGPTYRMTDTVLQNEITEVLFEAIDDFESKLARKTKPDFPNEVD